MNLIKDNWEDDDEDDSPQLIMSQAEQMKLHARKMEEDADHQLTEDLFLSNNPAKTNPIMTQTNILVTKQTPAKLKHIITKQDNDKRCKEKVDAKQKVAASKEKHASVFGDTELDELQDKYSDYQDRF